VGVLELFGRRRASGPQPPVEVVVGGVYSVARAQGTYGVVRVLAFESESDVVWARTYDLRSSSRPQARDFDFDSRDGDSLVENLPWGIGALPVSQRLFAYWRPQLMFVSGITARESKDVAPYIGEAQPWNELRYP